jgi:hypothetical protein
MDLHKKSNAAITRCVAPCGLELRCYPAPLTIILDRPNRLRLAVLPALVTLALAALTLLPTALVILMTALLALVGIGLRLALLVLVLPTLLAVALFLIVLVVGIVGHDVLLVRG